MPVKRGDFLTGGGYPAIAKRVDDRLRAEFPLLQNFIEAAGPVPSLAELERLAAERVALAARMAALRQQIDNLRGAQK